MSAGNMSNKCATASDAGQMLSENWGMISSRACMRKNNPFFALWNLVFSIKDKTYIDGGDRACPPQIAPALCDNAVVPFLG